jgi:hypothetical protein
MGTKNQPGKFDTCYANADPDEPMFVLLGKLEERKKRSRGPLTPAESYV